MVAAGFQVTRPTPAELSIELHGAIDEHTAFSCEREVRAQVCLAKPGSLRLLWDLRGVSSYTLEGRQVLVRLQRFLADRAARTVYVAERPAPRGLALWTVHMSGCLHAHITTDLQAARSYLQGRGDPPTGVRPLASVRPGPLSGLRAKAAS